MSAPAGGRAPAGVRRQFLQFGIPAALVILGLVAIGGGLLLTVRRRLDADAARSAVTRTRLALAWRAGQDQRRLTESAWWDDSYAYLARPHRAGDLPWLTENFSEWLPAQYGDQSIRFLRRDGSVQWSWQAPGTGPAPALPLERLLPLLDSARSAAGLLALGGTLHEVAGAVVLPSATDRSGEPPHGYLLVTRPVARGTLAAQGALLGFQMELAVLDGPGDSSRAVVAHGDSVRTRFVAADLLGRPAVQVELRASREEFAALDAWLVGGYLLMTLLAVGLCAWGLRSAQHLLLGPFARLEAAMARLEAEGRLGPLPAEDAAREWAEFIARYNQMVRAREDAERGWRRAHDAALAANQAKSGFLARTSHEIRAPMNAVLGLADLLRRTPLTPDQSRYVEAVHSAGESLLALVNDLLDLSRVESGTLAIEQVPFDVRRLLDETIALFAPRAADRGVQLEQHLAPEVPARLLGDPVRLRQVLTNLLANALRFTPSGRVTVSLAVTGEGEETQVAFTVADTGIGMTREQREQLFTTHDGAGDSTPWGQDGRARLGLTICRDLVALMGGTIGVTSEPGEGSRFTFTLPLPAAPPVPARLPRDLSLEALRALYISFDALPDPDALQQLRGVGLRVTTDGSYHPLHESLLEAASLRDPFAVVVLEAERLHASLEAGLQGAHRGLWPRVAILVLLRQARPGDALRLAQLGATALLTLPARAEDLREAVAVARQVARDGLTWPLITRHWLLEARQLDADRAPAREAPAGARILVVDDDPINRLVAEAYLRGLASVVECAGSGEEALRRVACEGIDLVLLDCEMPGMDGYEAARRIRQLPGLRGKVPIVAVTASAMPGDRERCLAAGMNGHIPKPVRQADLARALREWLPTSPPAPGSPPVPAEGGVLASLAQAGSAGASLASRLAGHFAAQAPGQVRALRQAILAGDERAAAHLAQALRGTARVVGAPPVARLCEEIEIALERDALAEATVLADELATEADRAVALLGAADKAGPLDSARLQEIRRFEEEVPGLLEGMVELFLETVPRHRAALSAALAAEDAAGVRAAAHALKGSAPAARGSDGRGAGGGPGAGRPGRAAGGCGGGGGRDRARARCVV
ncbi:MAG: response regulator [Gemmatimonadetes bacterium]|nr:response regulator [Gemmatimonadota bacterium]